MKNAARTVVQSALGLLGYELVKKSIRPKHDTRHGLNLLFPTICLIGQRLQRPLSVIQVGAHDGQDEDAVALLLPKINCRAILVEPHPHLANKLREKYLEQDNIVVEELIVSRSNTPQNFFVSKDPSLSKVSSIYPELIMRHASLVNARRGSEEEKASIERLTVHSISIGALMKQHALKQLDLLAVDAEGCDLEIVSEVIEEKLEVSILYFEYINMTPGSFRGLLKSLTRAGYVLARSGYDILAVHQSVIESFAPELAT